MMHGFSLGFFVLLVLAFAQDLRPLPSLREIESFSLQLPSELTRKVHSGWLGFCHDLQTLSRLVQSTPDSPDR